MYFKDLDTPSLLIDEDIMLNNVIRMQNYANQQNVLLRPHTKTHKMPKLAQIQEKYGAKGITVAKVGEAEVMAKEGIKDIFIANQIVGKSKIERIKMLSETINISFGVDNEEQINEIEEVFKDCNQKAQVLIEIEVGEKRSGIIEEEDFILLLKKIKSKENINLKGVFSHDGHTYSAENINEIKQMFSTSTNRTLNFANIAKEMKMNIEVVSIGSTPSLILEGDIPSGVTEIRPGTYILMDDSQANVVNTKKYCAASVLTTVISKPTNSRIITDVGAKGLTAQRRTKGILKTEGLGSVIEYNNVHIYDVYDEHAIIYDNNFNKNVSIGEKVRIIPNHICPVSNLYDVAYLISKDKVKEEISISCRGKLQ